MVQPHSLPAANSALIFVHSLMVRCLLSLSTETCFTPTKAPTQCPQLRQARATSNCCGMSSGCSSCMRWFTRLSANMVMLDEKQKERESRDCVDVRVRDFDNNPKGLISAKCSTCVHFARAAPLRRRSAVRRRRTVQLRSDSWRAVEETVRACATRRGKACIQRRFALSFCITEERGRVTERPLVSVAYCVITRALPKRREPP